MSECDSQSNWKSIANELEVREGKDDVDWRMTIGVVIVGNRRIFRRSRVNRRSKIETKLVCLWTIEILGSDAIRKILVNLDSLW